jgi:hypothetical protein
VSGNRPARTAARPSRFLDSPVNRVLFMRSSKRQAIRNTFYRLGLHTTPKAVVQALAQQGIQVGEELVRLVRFRMLNEAARKRFTGVSMSVPSPAVRRRPQGFPGRHQG